MMARILIYVREKSNTKKGFIFPVNPEEIEIKSGGTEMRKYTLLGMGTVERPYGRGIKGLSFSGIFPNKTRRKSVFPCLATGDMDEKQLASLYSVDYKTWVSATKYIAYLEKWRTNGTLLNILITGTGINLSMYLDDYSYAVSGGFADFNFDVSFSQKRVISITTVPKKKTTSKKVKSTTKRVTPTYKTYKVKSGDNLWSIAKRYLGNGSRNKEIYKLNKSIIEKTAKKHGFKSSNSGWWIFPGTVLKLPKK